MSILTWLASAFASAIGYSVVRFTAYKVVLYALLVTVLPIVLLNVFYTIVEGVISLANSAVGSYGISSQVVQLTGLAAWFAIHLKIVEGVALLLSALVFRVALRMIPFTRL